MQAPRVETRIPYGRTAHPSSSALLQSRLAFHRRDQVSPVLTIARFQDTGSEARAPRREYRVEWPGREHHADVDWHHVVRSLQTLYWGAIGGLLGAGVVALPSVSGRDSVLPFMLAIPLGAVAGTLAAHLLLWKHWKLQQKESE